MMRTNELLATTDAQMWAKEWCRIASEIEEANDGRQVIDEGWMIGWFANAIEVGRDAGRKASTADILAAVRTLPGVEEERMCEYPEFNDPACYVGHPDPKPEDARQASKHSGCQWVLVVPLSPTDKEEE